MRRVCRLRQCDRMEDDDPIRVQSSSPVSNHEARPVIGKNCEGWLAIIRSLSVSRLLVARPESESGGLLTRRGQWPVADAGRRSV